MVGMPFSVLSEGVDGWYALLALADFQVSEAKIIHQSGIFGDDMSSASSTIITSSYNCVQSMYLMCLLLHLFISFYIPTTVLCPTPLYVPLTSQPVHPAINSSQLRAPMGSQQSLVY